MSAEIVNLRQRRKRREKAGREAEAAANRAKFGRTSGERARDAAEAAERARLLDGARLDAPMPDGEEPGG